MDIMNGIIPMEDGLANLTIKIAIANSDVMTVDSVKGE
jgi:hypothetical protein